MCLSTAAPAILDLGGHMQIGITALPPAITAARQISSARSPSWRCSASVRCRMCPPSRGGYPGHEADPLTGMLAPAGTPRKSSISFTRHREDVAAARSRRSSPPGLRPVGNTPAEFATQIKAESEKWGKVVRAAKLKIE